MPTRIYICDCCQNKCRSDWTDDQAVAELHRRFGPHWRPSRCVIVCEPCFIKLYGRATPTERSQAQ